MTPEQLRARARGEIAELGPEPSDAHDHALWLEERRGAGVLLASLADWDGRRLRQAALSQGELTEPVVVGCCSTRLHGSAGTRMTFGSGSTSNDS